MPGALVLAGGQGLGLGGGLWEKQKVRNILAAAVGQVDLGHPGIGPAQQVEYGFDQFVLGLRLVQDGIGRERSVMLTQSSDKRLQFGLG